MTDTFRVAIAGLGTVGAVVVDMLQSKKEQLSRRCGVEIQLVAVSARERNRDRGINISNIPWFDDPVEMATSVSADLIVELIGGESGVAEAICKNALGCGKHVVTANKALLAMQGTELAKLSEKAGVVLGYEASVAGGIPIIKALREGFAGNRINSVHGILNGTCNYILTVMRESGRTFDNVLSEAQELGYAEADPTFDIDGVDTAHKLALLSSVAFGSEVSFENVYIEGIRHITSEDINFAGELGYRIKLLGIAKRKKEGVEQRVYPCMVPIDTAIAHVEGVFNAVVIEGDLVGSSVLQGRGAGGGPTASSVISDIVDIARGANFPVFAVPVGELERRDQVSIDARRGAYYVRLMVLDTPGVIADVSAALRDENVSVESLLQRGRSKRGPVPVVLKLHETKELALRRALEKIKGLSTVVETPKMIRIETF